MIACLDVDYREKEAVAACVMARDWPDSKPAAKAVVRIDEVEPYEPGRFFRRELPCLLAVLEAIHTRPEVVIIDGYVWLGDERDPGLGAHLYEALGRQAAVIGVAKTRFLAARRVQEIHRGASRSPLYITAAGVDLQRAADQVRMMHGPNRIPTLLKRVDQLCRDRAGTKLGEGEKAC
jgi:deoxyribonuclease V